MARKTARAAKPKKKASSASKTKPKRKAAKSTPARAKARTRVAAKPRGRRATAKPKKRAATAPAKKTTRGRPKTKAKTTVARTKAKTGTTRTRVAARPKPKRPTAKPIVVPKWMERMRKVLEAERDRLTDQLEDVGNFTHHEVRGAAAEIATTDDDTIDMASQAVERERELALRSNLEDLLERVGKALSKIDQGEYGVCERCGQKIARERLKAVPHATMCVRCRAIIDG